MSKPKNNLVKLATKSVGNQNKGPTTKKIETEKEATVDDTYNNNNDASLKAKEVVENLLKDVPMDLKKDIIEKHEVEKEGDDWLTEQLSLLSAENDKLREESALAKENYIKLYDSYKKLKNGESQVPLITGDNLVPESELNNNIITLFNEVQANYLGSNQQRTAYTNMSTQHLLSKLLSFFPFLSKYRKF